MARVDISSIRRSQITEAAFGVFSEKGYGNTTVADIASKLDLGHSTVYRYFDNKLDIASSVIDEVLSRTMDALSMEPPEKIASLAEYREALMRIGSRLFDFLGDNPRLHRFIFFEGLQIDESITARIDDAFSAVASYTESHLRNGIARGFISGDVHPREAAYAVNGMVWEAARRLCLEPEITGEAKAAWSETVVGMMLDGMGVKVE
ncbi:MAG: TetR/AcrR family transcriptional regulator [Actinobacteria bacterium]|nr:TetR/AcrR family transcriptional regulator [Actinomycetota bacterium]MBU1944224.1 TetR/AcrR family transcriptional regulator [Actinomycetota bacterium]MBU2688383.1 TetR/AcrR family transcriptional regulator [Actinomycetota bacterium]